MMTNKLRTWMYSPNVMKRYNYYKFLTLFTVLSHI
jgi:hypothetical protein